MTQDIRAGKGVALEVLGECMTNTTKGSQHEAKVEYRHLWSYAQQAALIAVSEKSEKDGCYHLITDPERRAKRIAAHYADLYFKSAEKSGNKLQFYWPALAAFVVKDIVEAYRFARTGVLHREWSWSLADVLRNSVAADVGSKVLTSDSPYQHAIRTYSALAKGNLWLFMDIYPWLWFVLEYGINSNGSINRNRINESLAHRNWNSFQDESKEAIAQLPYAPPWIDRLKKSLHGDAIYRRSKEYFAVSPKWMGTSGYGQHSGAAYNAHNYCRANAKNHDAGYRTPPGSYWKQFKEAFYVMEAEHIEMTRIAMDEKGLASVVKCRKFAMTKSITQAYQCLLKEYDVEQSGSKRTQQFAELLAIAEQEQINVLQPLIYDDTFLKETMDMNHRFSRQTNGWISPKFKVIYRASPINHDPQLESVFDPPDDMEDRLIGRRESLPNQSDRMKFVAKIAKDFHHLMTEKRGFMNGEINKIRQWLHA